MGQGPRLTLSQAAGKSSNLHVIQKSLFSILFPLPLPSANSVISILVLAYSQKWVRKTVLWKASTVIFVIRESHIQLPHGCEEVLLSCCLILSLAESANGCYLGTESISAALGFTLTNLHTSICLYLHAYYYLIAFCNRNCAIGE